MTLLCKDERLVVSVFMITYQHGKYIKQALDSILVQQTDFPFEICIGEDESQDGTRQICQEYAAKYPRIRLFLRSRNDPSRKKYFAPAMFNQVETLKACQGKYIALLEGDDYWTDPLKLQKQVDFLEAHPECSMVFTRALIVKDGRILNDKCSIPCDMISYRTLLEKDFIETCTVMYRNLFKGVLPKYFYDFPVGDWPLHLLHAQQGEIGYLDCVTGAYRIHDQGAYQGLKYVKRFEKEILLTQLLAKWFGLSKELARKKIRCLRRDIVRRCLIWGHEPYSGRMHLLKLLLEGGFPLESFREAWRLAFWFFSPFCRRFWHTGNQKQGL